MVRLTDLVGTGNREKSSVLKKSFSGTPRKPASGNERGFLPAQDLASIYDLSEKPQKQDGPPSIPVKTETLISESAVEEKPRESQPQPEQTSPPAVEPALQSVSGQVPAETPAEQQENEPLPPPPEQEYKPEKAPQKPLPGTLAYHQERGQSEPVDERKFLEESDAIHIELLDLLGEVYSEGSEGNIPNVGRLVEPIMRLINVCMNSNSILRKAVRLKKGGESRMSHCLNVAVLAIKIGISRAYTQERLFSLAMCALLGDIGMTQVNPAILNKKGKLEPEEFQEIKNHVLYSRDIAIQLSNKLPFLAPIVYQIHERENGNGYPEGLRGGNIHEFAKIIGMCDVYIAMTSPKQHRGDFSGYETLQQIISRRGIDFNAGVIKSLIDVISVFPLESLVKLNNSAIGRVIDISPVHPTRPKLNILVDNDGEHLKSGKVLDLEKEPLLYIEDPDIEESAIL